MPHRSAKQGQPPQNDPADQMLRRHVVDLLEGGGAHLAFDDAIADLPAEARGKRPTQAQGGFPHSVWRLVEHIRIAQQDILDYIDNTGDPLNWPDDYWPNDDAPASDAAWEQSLQALRDDMQRAVDIAKDNGTDLLTPLPHDRDKAPLRQLLLAADHNAYHIAQIVMVRRMIGAWG